MRTEKVASMLDRLLTTPWPEGPLPSWTYASLCVRFLFFSLPPSLALTLTSRPQWIASLAGRQWRGPAPALPGVTFKTPGPRCSGAAPAGKRIAACRPTTRPSSAEAPLNERSARRLQAHSHAGEHVVVIEWKKCCLPCRPGPAGAGAGWPPPNQGEEVYHRGSLC